jgi:hypothetical protein
MDLGFLQANSDVMSWAPGDKNKSFYAALQAIDITPKPDSLAPANVTSKLKTYHCPDCRLIVGKYDD